MMPESTPHPDGGVAIWRHSWPGEPSMPVLFGNRPTAKAPLCEPGTWFPVAQAARLIKLDSIDARQHVGGGWWLSEAEFARLIDVDDPQVRELIVWTVAQNECGLTRRDAVCAEGCGNCTCQHTADAIIAALKTGAPE